MLVVAKVVMQRFMLPHICLLKEFGIGLAKVTSYWPINQPSTCHGKVAHYTAENQGSYEPHFDWGTCKGFAKCVRWYAFTHPKVTGLHNPSMPAQEGGGSYKCLWKSRRHRCVTEPA